MPTSIMVIRTAEKILINATEDVSTSSLTKWYDILLTGNREPGHLLKRSRKVKYPEKDQSNHSPDHITCGVVGNGTKADGPGKNVTAHAENEEYGLSSTAEFSAKTRHAKGLEKYFEGVSHVMDLGFLS
jgi:hypothetical protein